MLIRDTDLMVGDEVIISCHSNLKYLKILRVPKKVRGKFKVSYSPYPVICEADISLHTKTTYQDLTYRDVWLVKREGVPV